MRDRRFVAEHRGGPLKKAQHHQLMRWAIDCTEHVLPLFGEKIDPRLENALKVAKSWELGLASVGDARKAAFDVIVLAREMSNPTSIALARSVMHAVATAHMADHSLGAAWYALRAIKATGKSVETEKKWQNEQLPPEIRELILTARQSKKFNTKSMFGSNPKLNSFTEGDKANSFLLIRLLFCLKCSFFSIGALPNCIGFVDVCSSLTSQSAPT